MLIPSVIHGPSIRRSQSPQKPIPLNTRSHFSSSTANQATCKKWELARLQNSLPQQVERTDWNALETMLKQQGLEHDMPKLKAAYHVAEKAHAGVYREEGSPYIHHPARACAILIEQCGVRDSDILAASLLHDVVEDSPVTLEQLKGQFGERTAELVDWVTKPDASGFPSKGARNHFQSERMKRAPEGARLVKIADRLDNVSDLHLNPIPDKLDGYVKDTEDHYLELAQSTSPTMHRALTHRLSQLRRVSALTRQIAHESFQAGSLAQIA
jgi:(p)ppGpp synthase/HD superfamily hydrolase